jgi:hypothetical protein
MKNLIVGPNAITALVAGNLADIFTAENCYIVYKSDGTYQSWQPNRELNAISTIEIGSGYLAIMKETLDVTGTFCDGGSITAGIYNLSGHDVRVDSTISGVTVTTGNLANGAFYPGSTLPGNTDTMRLHAKVAAMYGVFETDSNTATVIDDITSLEIDDQIGSFAASSFQENDVYLVVSTPTQSPPAIKRLFLSSNVNETIYCGYHNSSGSTIGQVEIPGNNSNSPNLVTVEAGDIPEGAVSMVFEGDSNTAYSLVQFYTNNGTTFEADQNLIAPSQADLTNLQFGDITIFVYKNGL